MKFAIITFMLTLLVGSAVAADFSGVRFIMISAEDKAAVVKTPQGELNLLKEGDKVDEDNSIVGFDGKYVIIEGPGEWAPQKFLVEVAKKGEMNVTRLARRPIEMYQFKGEEVTSFKSEPH